MATPKNVHYLGSRDDWDDARRQLEGAIRAVTPYRPNRAGRVVLDHNHANAFKPYCRPRYTIADTRAVSQPDGTKRRVPCPEYMAEVMIETSATPFPEDPRPAEVQAEESKAIYLGSAETIALMMAYFAVRKRDIPKPSTEDTVKALTKLSLEERMRRKRCERLGIDPVAGHA